MKQKSFFTLIIAIVVAGGLIGGAFAGGIAIGKNQGEEKVNLDIESQIKDLTSRFGKEGTRFDPATQIPGGILGKGGTLGKVEKIEGNILTLSAIKGTTEVQISESTTIQKMDEGSLNDLSAGVSITVSGEQQEDGSIKATNIYIIPNFMYQLEK